MNNLAGNPSSDSPEAADEAALTARAQILRAVLQSIPHDQREAVLAQVRDLLPASFDQKRGVQRGGDVLNNVLLLFRSDPKERDSALVIKELAQQGKRYEPQPVRLALNYLNSRRILQRVGYGKYRLENGDIVDGLP